MNDIQMLVGGESTPASAGATFERRNPMDASVATRAPAATPADAFTELRWITVQTTPRHYPF